MNERRRDVTIGEAVRPDEVRQVREIRPWGSFTVLRDLDAYKLKSLTVNPGHQLSLQLHRHRDEHWIVVTGAPTVTIDDRTFQAKPGDYLFIPRKTRHRLGNATATPLEIIEVQQGDCLWEDDIIRLEDDYCRV
jgi:mannose-6-phosphate isomerase